MTEAQKAVAEAMKKKTKRPEALRGINPDFAPGKQPAPQPQKKQPSFIRG